jgi:phospholipid N-methyltransferase
MRHDDRLDLVEINPSFVEVLHKRIQHERAFRAASDRICIMCRAVEDLQSHDTYDAIVSGLPLNNFPAAGVKRILDAFERLAKPHGTLSFFEYIAIRKAKTLVGPRIERQRLEAVGRVLGDFLLRTARREAVWLNVPPAWVHHVHFGAIK